VLAVTAAEGKSEVEAGSCDLWERKTNKFPEERIDRVISHFVDLSISR
jgi:hypothetical protein